MEKILIRALERIRNYFKGSKRGDPVVEARLKIERFYKRSIMDMHLYKISRVAVQMVIHRVEAQKGHLCKVTVEGSGDLDGGRAREEEVGGWRETWVCMVELGYSLAGGLSRGCPWCGPQRYFPRPGSYRSVRLTTGATRR